MGKNGDADRGISSGSKEAVVAEDAIAGGKEVAALESSEDGSSGESKASNTNERGGREAKVVAKAAGADGKEVAASDLNSSSGNNVSKTDEAKGDKTQVDGGEQVVDKHGADATRKDTAASDSNDGSS